MSLERIENAFWQVTTNHLCSPAAFDRYQKQLSKSIGWNRQPQFEKTGADPKPQGLGFIFLWQKKSIKNISTI
jgi:hypothetical protein